MTTTPHLWQKRQYIKPRLDRVQAVYRTLLMAGITLHLDGDNLRMESAVAITDMARRQVELHKDKLIQYLRSLPPEPTVDPGSNYGFGKLDEMEF